MNWNKFSEKFVVLDGPDGCGKSTQIKLLADFLHQQNVSCQITRDPGGTRISEQIRAILLDNEHDEMSVRCETLLYLASRAQLYSEIIKPALAQRKCVLCDRWLSSTYAYQAVAGMIGDDWLLNLADVALVRSWPDLTIIIDLPSEQGLARLPQKPDRMEEKPLDFHRRVRDAFLHLAKIRPGFVVLDGAGSVQEVHQRLIKELTDYVPA